MVSQHNGWVDGWMDKCFMTLVHLHIASENELS
jgi:hypothetical protein